MLFDAFEKRIFFIKRNLKIFFFLKFSKAKNWSHFCLQLVSDIPEPFESNGFSRFNGIPRNVF